MLSSSVLPLSFLVGILRLPSQLIFILLGVPHESVDPGRTAFLISESAGPDALPIDPGSEVGLTLNPPMLPSLFCHPGLIDPSSLNLPELITLPIVPEPAVGAILHLLNRPALLLQPRLEPRLILHLPEPCSLRFHPGLNKSPALNSPGLIFPLRELPGELRLACRLIRHSLRWSYRLRCLGPNMPFFFHLPLVFFQLPGLCLIVIFAGKNRSDRLADFLLPVSRRIQRLLPKAGAPVILRSCLPPSGYVVPTRPVHNGRNGQLCPLRPVEPPTFPGSSFHIRSNLDIPALGLKGGHSAFASLKVSFMVLV